MSDTTVYMTFGKYKGEDIKDVPTRYLNWVARNVSWFEKEALKELEGRPHEPIKDDDYGGEMEDGGYCHDYGSFNGA